MRLILICPIVLFLLACERKNETFGDPFYSPFKEALRVNKVDSYVRLVRDINGMLKKWDSTVVDLNGNATVLIGFHHGSENMVITYNDLGWPIDSKFLRTMTQSGKHTYHKYPKERKLVIDRAGLTDSITWKHELDYNEELTYVIKETRTFLDKKKKVIFNYTYKGDTLIQINQTNELDGYKDRTSYIYEDGRLIRTETWYKTYSGEELTDLEYFSNKTGLLDSTDGHGLSRRLYKYYFRK